jgi:starvation-inducible DNA-binding protein
MASIATSSHLPALGEPHEREAIGRELQGTLHDLINLALIGKQLHWAVIGPLFHPLHLQLDEFVDSWRALGDKVAERAIALGFVPNGQPSAVASGSQLKAVPHTAIEDHAVVRELVNRVAQASELARERMDRAGELDAVSEDVLIEVLRKLEEQQWMLRAQLTGRS